MTEALDELGTALVEQLDADTSLSLEAKVLVYAAFEGDQALSAALAQGGTLPVVDTGAGGASAGEPLGAYLTRVSVSGFRGVGPRRCLDLKPGPGLTVVCGRNGSGKSSFAEAVEFALTGRNERWAEDRAAEWRDGWRNLHQGEPAVLEVDLLVEGRSPAQTIVRRRWPAGGDLADAVAEVQPAGAGPQPLSTLGWQQPLETFRPFLTYNELGDALTGRPSALYDALWRILGLERITSTQARLTEAAKKFRDAAAAVKADAVRLAGQARDLAGDERAVALATLLGKRTWDLAAIEAAADDDGSDETTALGALRQAAVLAGPDLDTVAAAAQALRAAARDVDALQGTDAQRCALDADLLQRAIAHHDAAGDGQCPVCRQGTLDAAWHADATARVAELRQAADTAIAARRRLTAAVEAARRLLTAAPPVLTRSADTSRAGHTAVDGSAGLERLPGLVSAWQQYTDAPADPLALAAHLEQHAPDLAAAIQDVAAAAAAELDRRQSTWRPVAHAAQAWLVTARQAARDADSAKAVTAAATWVKAAGTMWANARLAPLSQQSGMIWERLRQESNVSLGPVTLAGTGNRRHVRLDVAVDGAPGSALGIMSQGELHALALSLFLPRATVPASPFRFLVIDDPVQAMDPAKVDGLAQVLADVAAHRQVVVFTHDDRLPAAIRRLRLPATVLEVTRRHGSVVDIVPSEDPALRYLRDASSLLKDEAVDPAVAARVVPGLCCLALDAACLDAIRARRLAAGVAHADLETLIEDNPKLYPRMALALFDDLTRTGDVLRRLNQYGTWAPAVFKACNTGAHDGATSDQLAAMVTDTRTLVTKIQP